VKDISYAYWSGLTLEVKKMLLPFFFCPNDRTRLNLGRKGLMLAFGKMFQKNVCVIINLKMLNKRAVRVWVKW
jgi:hypothetical protein